MDPNEALRLAREAVGELLQADDDGNFTDPQTTNLGQLIEAFTALDEWLSRDGFLPDDWRPEEDKPKFTRYDVEAHALRCLSRGCAGPQMHGDVYVLEEGENR